MWKLDAAKNCINYGTNISRIKSTECFKRLNRRLIAGGAYSSKNVTYFGILTTDTVRRSENFIKGGKLCVVHFFQDFSHETRSNEKQQSKQDGENEQLKREKKVN